jgi:hypothetical protein
MDGTVWRISSHEEVAASTTGSDIPEIAKNRFSNLVLYWVFLESSLLRVPYCENLVAPIEILQA